MDFTTTYMGLELKNPIIVSSSKLTSKVDDIKKCADQGAAAVVLKSLFEEQLLADANKLLDQDSKYFWYPEAVDYINEHSKEQGVNEYLELIRSAKKEVDIPVFASINCTTAKEWPKFAKNLELAGADGIELNIAIFPFNVDTDSKAIEATYVEIIKEVKKHVNIPVSVKVGSLFTNPVRLISQLCHAGADGIVMFNRYYRPDIDIDSIKVVRDNYLSNSAEMTRTLRWVSILANRISCPIAANTGVHDAKGMIKQLLGGASAVQICSTLYNNGIGYIDTMLFDLGKWMEKQGFNSVSEFKGKIGEDEANIAAFERVQFMRKAFGDLH